MKLLSEVFKKNKKKQTGRKYLKQYLKQYSKQVESIGYEAHH